MTSLGEVYGGTREQEADPGRLYAGVGLFLVGAGLVLAGVVVATTDLLRGGGTSIYEVRELGGILAGVGVPAVFLGILTVLPANRDTRAAAAVGAAIAALGVALFAHAYPCQWSGATCAPAGDLTLPTVGVYALGAIVSMWHLFVGIATFKRRNDPGGTVRMSITRRGETDVVEVDPRDQGSVGTFGSGSSTPVQTVSGAGDAEVMGSGTTDGGAAESDIQEIGSGNVPADRYCGNCAAFEYVRTEDGIKPYCGTHDEVMGDMDPCEEWTPNGR
ncbi:MAG: ribonuclease BN [Haloferacaceae archaeon]